MSVPALQVYIDGQGTVSASNYNTFQQTCDNVAELRDFIGISGLQVFIRGTSIPNDGGQGSFYWNSTGTAPDDDGVTTVVPTGAVTGEWTRIVNIFTTNTFTNLTVIDNLTVESLTSGELVAADSNKNLVSTTILPNGTIGTTQAANDDSNKVATTEYADRAATAAGKGQLQHDFLTGGSTFTTPPDITTGTIFKITLVGGGGAGSVGQGNYYGAAGATGIKWVSGLSPSTNYTYSIGLGGVYSGIQNGGNTTFSDGVTTYTAGGGNAGGGSPPTGGACINCDISITGQTPTVVPNGTTIGTAGSSLWGSGSGTTNGSVAAPTGYGSSGGFEENGRQGMILIEWIA